MSFFWNSLICISFWILSVRIYHCYCCLYYIFSYFYCIIAVVIIVVTIRVCVCIYICWPIWNTAAFVIKGTLPVHSVGRSGRETMWVLQIIFLQRVATWQPCCSCFYLVHLSSSDFIWVYLSSCFLILDFSQKHLGCLGSCLVAFAARGAVRKRRHGGRRGSRGK